MVIARKLSIDELGFGDENALPLDNLDANFTVGDALIHSEAAAGGNRTPTLTDGKATVAMWPPADVIIGNPPFNGAKKLKPDLGDAYVNALRKAYPNVPGMADFCVYWFRRSHDHLPELTKSDPFVGRAGLVGTQNIRNNKSREGGLDHIAGGGGTGTVVDAVDNQPWSGEANVHVSIANWVKTRDDALLPKDRRLWKVDNKPALGQATASREGGGAVSQAVRAFRGAGGRDQRNVVGSDGRQRRQSLTKRHSSTVQLPRGGHWVRRLHAVATGSSKLGRHRRQACRGRAPLPHRARSCSWYRATQSRCDRFRESRSARGACIRKSVQSRRTACLAGSISQSTKRGRRFNGGAAKGAS